MRTPSQTVGPFFSIGLSRRAQNEIGDGGARIYGRVLDGAGAPVGDALLELWHPDVGFARCATDRDGAYSFSVPAGARRFELMVFARGLLKPVVTRVYLGGDADAENATMVATREEGEFLFDVRLRGEGETASFEL